MTAPSEYRIYAIIPRNLDVPGEDGTMKKVTVTCGRANGYSGHCGALLQLMFVKAFLTMSSAITMQNVDQILDVSQQDILALMVANSDELFAERDKLKRQGVRTYDYVDADKQFSGDQVTAIVLELLQGTRRDVVRHLKPWRCGCNSVHKHSTEAS